MSAHILIRRNVLIEGSGRLTRAELRESPRTGAVWAELPNGLILLPRAYETVNVTDLDAPETGARHS